MIYLVTNYVLKIVTHFCPLFPRTIVLSLCYIGHYTELELLKVRGYSKLVEIQGGSNYKTILIKNFYCFSYD